MFTLANGSSASRPCCPAARAARCFHGRRLMRGAMRHHWLLLGACGWVLLILMFVSKFISFRAVDGKTSLLILVKQIKTTTTEWLLKGVLTPLFLSFFFNYLDYGDRAGGQSWTVPGTKVIKSAPASSPGKPDPKPSDQVITLVRPSLILTKQQHSLINDILLTSALALS